MTVRTFRCDDGTVIRASTDDQFVGMVEWHLRAAHPELAGRLSRREVLALATGETGHLDPITRQSQPPAPAEEPR